MTPLCKNVWCINRKKMSGEYINSSDKNGYLEVVGFPVLTLSNSLFLFLNDHAKQQTLF